MKIEKRILIGFNVNGCYIGVLPLNEVLLMVDIAQKRKRFNRVVIKYAWQLWHIFIETK